jgi:hypothetical protein
LQDGGIAGLQEVKDERPRGPRYGLASTSRLSFLQSCPPAILQCGVFLLYAALAVALTYPLSFHLGDHIMSPGTDTNLFIWTLGWDLHALVHQPLRMFDANIFYPFHDTLAYSENLIGSALLVAPVQWLVGNPVLTMNVAALVTIPLCAFGAYLLAYRVGTSFAGALVAGLVFGFCAPRFFRLDQLHLTNVQWIPFCLIFLHAYFQEQRPRDARLAAGFFTLQALTSGHGAVFLIVAAAALKLYLFATGTPLDLRRRARDVGVIGVLLLVPSVLILLPYHAAQTEMGLRRTLDNWHVPWESFVAAPTWVDTRLVEWLLPDVDVFHNAGAYLFPGVLTLILATIGMTWRSERDTFWRRLAVVLDVLALIEFGAALFGTFASDPRIRVGGVVVASARHVWRAWLWCAGAVAGRLAIARLVPLLTRPRWPRVDMALFYTLLFGLCLWLSIGPPYGLWQYVYWVPGFNFIRAPSRFMILGVLALAVLAAVGFDALTRRLRGATRAVCSIVVLALLALEFAAMPLPMTAQSPALPAIDRWLATQPTPFVVAELPLPDSTNITVREDRESTYILHSMAHWQKTIHGYSGLLPDFSDELYSQLAHFPDQTSIRRLTDIGVTYLVVHDAALAERARAVPQLAFVHAESDGQVFRVSTIR